MRKALLVDTETSGLSPQKDEIAEIACVLVGVQDYEKSDAEALAFGSEAEQLLMRQRRWRILSTYSGIAETKVPLSPQIQMLTHIAPVHQAGRRIMTPMVSRLVAEAECVVAWNAPFDRGFCEASFGDWGKPWLDAMRVVPWNILGAKHLTLTYVAAECGGFVNPFPHSALGDTLTMARLVAPYLGWLMKTHLNGHQEPRPEPVVATLDLGRDRNDELKQLGFRWNPERKMWLREFSSRVEAEAFLDGAHATTRVWGRIL